jgi:hypothetical protein
MRRELSEAVGRVLAHRVEPGVITPELRDQLLRAANLVTQARSSVEFDHHGDVMEVHAPEMPTRFAKQLLQVVRGATTLGIAEDRALALAMRVARDSLLPVRLAILQQLSANGPLNLTHLARALNTTYSQVRRQTQALHALKLLTLDNDKYALASGITADVLTVRAFTLT